MNGLVLTPIVRLARSQRMTCRPCSWSGTRVPTDRTDMTQPAHALGGVRSVSKRSFAPT